MNRKLTKAGVAGGLVGLLFLHGVLFWSQRESIRAGYPDFTIFYAAAQILRQGQGHSLYDARVQLQEERAFASRKDLQLHPLPYNHPPFEALLFVPLSRLSYVTAYSVWGMLNLGMLLGLPFVLRRQVAILQRPRAPILFVLATLAFFPLFAALFQGQDVVVLLLLQVLSFVALKKGSDFLAGLWLGLGVFKVHLVAPLLLVLLIWKRWRVGVGFALTTLCLAAISIAIVGWAGVRQYPAFVMQVEREGWGVVVPAYMPNLRGLIGWSMGGAEKWRWLTPLLSIGLIIFTAGFTKMYNGLERDSFTFDLSFSAAVVATLLAGYHTYTYDLSLLVLALLLLVNAWSERDWPRLEHNTLLWLPAVLFFCTPLYLLGWFRDRHLNPFGLALCALLLGIYKEIALNPRVICRRQV